MNTGKVIAIEVVFVERTLNRIIKLWQVILSNYLVKSSQTQEIFVLILSQLVLLAEPVLNSGNSAV